MDKFHILQKDEKPVGFQGLLLPQRSDQEALVRGKGHYKIICFPLSNVI